MSEDHFGVVKVEVIAQQNARRRSPHEFRESGLSVLDRFPTLVLAVQLQQIEGVQKDAGLVLSPPQTLEIGKTCFVARHRLAVDQEGLRLDGVGSLPDK